MPEFVIYAAAGLAIFVAGVVLSTKIKDWFAGVPTSLRAELNTLETSVKGQVKTAQAAVVADVKSKVVIPVPVLATATGTAAPKA
jgi:hypothetical protein